MSDQTRNAEERRTFLSRRRRINIVINSRLKSDDLTPSFGSLNAGIPFQVITDGLMNGYREFLKYRMSDELRKSGQVGLQIKVFKKLETWERTNAWLRQWDLR